MNTDPLAIGLPKWPALVVAGKRVTEGQAAEILIRTDAHVPSFEYGGNDHEGCAALDRLFGVPDPLPWSKNDDTDEVKTQKFKAIEARWAAIDGLRRRLGVLEIEYLRNSRIMSAWIGGPHGWCNWNGTIFCNNYNIGKWPHVQGVLKEWETIAAAFPFLSLKAWLYSGETGEDHSVPVVRYDVGGGKAGIQVADPNETVAPPDFDMNSIITTFTMPASLRECGIYLEDLKAKLVLVYGPEWPKVGNDCRLGISDTESPKTGKKKAPKKGRKR